MAQTGPFARGAAPVREAADAYREVINQHPNLALAHNKLGNVLFKAGRYEDAISAFEKAVSLQPGYLEAEVSWANTLHMLGKLPAEKRAHYAAKNAALGDRVRNGGNNAFAIHCYRQALNLKSDLIEAHHGLAQAFHAQADMDKALQSYRKVLALDPQHGEALSFLSRSAPPPDRPAGVLHADA